jgi:hypothetical protein
MVRIRFASVGLLSLLAACGGSGDDSSGSSSGSGSPPVVNSAPTANAGGGQSVNKGDVVTLDGSGSKDPEGGVLAYRWMQTSGPAVTLSSGTAAKPSFSAPASAGTIVFSLVVSDGVQESEGKSVSIQVNDRQPTPQIAAEQQAPTSSAVTLDASHSSDPDGDALTYTWQQMSGPTVTITVTATGQIQFTSPSAPGTLTFNVSVSDGANPPVTATVIVVVSPTVPTNRAPFANAGADQITGRGIYVQLAGQGFDPDGRAVTYTWQQVSGATVVLNDANQQYANFYAPSSLGDLRFALQVSDGVLTTTDETAVKVINAQPTISNGALSPASPYTHDDLTFTGVVSDWENDPLTVSYQWYRNGTLVSGQSGTTFPASLTTRNDVIKVRVTAKDTWDEATTEASVTILDSPAVLSATPPTTVQYGATISFQVSAIDDDGDAIPPLVLAHGPAGMSLSNTGVVTWTARGPMFDRETDVHWGVAVTGQPASLLSRTVKVQDAARAAPMRRTDLMIPQTVGAMSKADLNADGVPEALVVTVNALYELGYGSGSYRQRWVKPLATATEGAVTATNAVAVTAADVMGSAAQEIFVSQRGVLVRLDGQSRRESARWVSDAGWGCASLVAADLDGDNQKELVCLERSSYGNNDGRLRLFDPLTLQPFWTSASGQYGGQVAVGNVDSDAALEIVAAAGYVFDGATRLNEWAAGTSFGNSIALADMDGDGVEEILGSQPSTPPATFAIEGTAWDARTHAVAWSLNLMYGGQVQAAGDLNSDGRAEMLLSDIQTGGVMAVTYDTGTHLPQLLWRKSVANFQTSAILVGDFDNDGQVEVMWSGGVGVGGRDGLWVADGATGATVEWTSLSRPQFDGPFLGGRLAQLAPGRRELIFASPRTDDGYHGFRAFAVNPTTGDFQVSPELGSNWAGAGAIDTADVDLDGVDEVLVGTAALYDGEFRSVDLASGTVEWQSQPNLGNSRAVTHADCNADGRPDFVALTTAGRIYVYDPVSQVELERIQFDNSGVDIEARDGGALGRCELIVASQQQLGIYRYSTLLGLQRVASRTVSTNFGATISDIATGDLDGDGDIETVVVTADYSSSTITTYDDQLNPVASFPVAGKVTGVTIERGSGSRRNLLVAISEPSQYFYFDSGISRLYARDPWSGAEVWQSPLLDGAIAANAVQFVDTSGDGELEISIGMMGAGLMLTR